MYPPRTAGAYVLAVRLPAPLALNIPRLGSPRLPAGMYAYCGSARGPGGLAARIARHLRLDKARRWHIDHLTTTAPVSRIFWEVDGDECALVDCLLEAGATASVPGFGSSDCRSCPAHLLAVTTSILCAALAGLPTCPLLTKKQIPRGS